MKHFTEEPQSYQSWVNNKAASERGYGGESGRIGNNHVDLDFINSRKLQ